MGGSAARRSISVFNQAHKAKSEITRGRVARFVGVSAQRAQQAGLVCVNLRWNFHAVPLFIAIPAKKRRACGDCAVAFVGVLIRPATAKGFAAGFTMPGKLMGAGTSGPGRAVGLAGHQTAPLSRAAAGTQNEAISAAFAMSAFMRSNMTERENAGHFREVMG